jgi:hypothetical protein
MKKCSKCKLEKTLEEFGKNKTRKDGLSHICKKCRIINSKKYYESNIDNIKKYRENNKEKIKDINKRHRENNKEYNKKYKNINRKKLSEKCKIRRQTDSLYKLRGYIRNMINKLLKSKNFRKKSKNEIILGCTYQEFKSYLESKFEDWMNWDNYGNPKDGIFELNKSWDIDHIIPTASAINEEEIIKLNHYTNLQPLCSYTNRFIKRDKILD